MMVEKKLANYWERLAIYVMGFLISIACWLYIDMKERVEDMNVRINALQVDKVSRVELKEMEERLYKRVDSVKADIGSMKEDIIGRLDWYIVGRGKDKR
jgi:hypothetical protein